MHMHLRNVNSVCIICGIAILLSIVITSCNTNTTTPSKAGTFTGDSVSVGNGKAKSWVTLDDNGNPMAVGVNFGETSLQNLTDTGGVEFTLAIPSQGAATGLNHIGFNWNPRGHEPRGIYDKPHFDIHFYYLSVNDRMMIQFGKDMNGILQKYLPPYFGTDSTSIPMMGVHYLDITSGEFNGKPFDKTFLYGFNKGSLAFLEPMITKEYFEAKPTVEIAIPQPAEWQMKNRYYPTKYSVTYNATKKEYSVSLLGFILK